VVDFLADGWRISSSLLVECLLKRVAEAFLMLNFVWIISGFASTSLSDYSPVKCYDGLDFFDCEMVVLRWFDISLVRL
jgi:hypothetical protein